MTPTTPAVLLLPLVLAGCASQPAPTAPAAPVAAYADMQFETMAATGPHEVTIRETSPTFAFPEGSSAFAALALPPRQQRTYLRFRSDTENSTYQNMKVLIPRFMFLDPAKAPIEAAVPELIVRDSNFWTGIFYTGQVRIPEQAAFVVVAPAPKLREPLVLIAPGGVQHTLPLLTAGKSHLELSTQAMAMLADSVVTVSGARAQMFVADAIDGKSIHNSIGASAQTSYGRGFELTAVTTQREVPARKLKVKLLGRNRTGAPIMGILDAITGDDPTVEGVVDFEPVDGGRYVVKGTLDNGGSSIWIEDAGTGSPVTEKIVSP